MNRTKEIIQADMRKVLAEYQSLKAEFDELNGVDRVAKFEIKQRELFGSLKAVYSTEIGTDGAIKLIDWDGIERDIFNKENLAQPNLGFYLNFDMQGDYGLLHGMRGQLSSFAVDEADAKRAIEREARRQSVIRGKK